MMDKLSAVKAIIISVMGRFKTQMQWGRIFLPVNSDKLTAAWCPMRTDTIWPITIENVATYHVTLASIKVMSG